MFDSISPQQNSSAKPPTEPGNASVSVAGDLGGSAPGGQTPGIGDPDASRSVYTMPREFLPKAPSLTKAHSGVSWKWVIAIVTVVTLVVGGAAAAIIVVLQQGNEEQPQAFPLPTNNSNANANTNANSNGGTTLNTNVNGNLANNINNGLFPGQNTNANTNTNSSSSGVLPFVNRTVVPLAADKDRDQLTDAEEALYGTKVTLPDSDSDGFIDGSEVVRGYSPLSAEKTLSQDGITLKYQNTAYGWAMEYPSKWVSGSTDDAQRTVLFTSDAVQGEFVQVSFVDNPTGLTAKDWYIALFTDADPNSLQETTVGGLEGIVSPDGYAMYLADENYIISVAYNFGTKKEVTFKTTFQMMLSTFTYNPKSATSQPSGNSNKANTNTTGANTNQTNTNNTQPTTL